MSQQSERPSRRGKPFEPGDPRAGRPKGSKNKTTIEVREMARKLIEDPAYVKSLKVRLRIGEAGALETTLWHYAYGKPTESVELTGKNGGPLQVEDQTRNLTSDELRRRAAELVATAKRRMGEDAAAEPGEAGERTEGT